jgi:hypothetical protein
VGGLEGRGLGLGKDGSSKEVLKERHKATLAGPGVHILIFRFSIDRRVV